jgi:1,4-alpha-glucan branching enzyme
VTFTLNANPGSLVAVAGSFNDWDPLRHPLTDADGTGCYRVTLALAPGSYEYKFVINGTWCVDPNCPDWAQNEYGTLNSVRKV